MRNVDKMLIFWICKLLIEMGENPYHILCTLPSFRKKCKNENNWSSRILGGLNWKFCLRYVIHALTMLEEKLYKHIVFILFSCWYAGKVVVTMKTDVKFESSTTNCTIDVLGHLLRFKRCQLRHFFLENKDINANCIQHICS